MSDETIRLGDQSKTTVEQPNPNPALALIKADVARLVLALEDLISELSGIRPRLDRIEKTLGEIAIGLGVAPR